MGGLQIRFFNWSELARVGYVTMGLSHLELLFIQSKFDVSFCVDNPVSPSIRRDTDHYGMNSSSSLALLYIRLE